MHYSCRIGSHQKYTILQIRRKGTKKIPDMQIYLQVFTEFVDFADILGLLVGMGYCRRMDLRDAKRSECMDSSLAS